jgi:hypothetical protein
MTDESEFTTKQSSESHQHTAAIHPSRYHWITGDMVPHQNNTAWQEPLTRPTRFCACLASVMILLFTLLTHTSPAHHQQSLCRGPQHKAAATQTKHTKCQPPVADATPNYRSMQLQLQQHAHCCRQHSSTVKTHSSGLLQHYQHSSVCHNTNVATQVFDAWSSRLPVGCDSCIDTPSHLCCACS